MGEHDELIPVFLTESIELLDSFDDELISLEKDPSNTELVHSIFRVVHSIKGMCGFLHFPTLEKLAHAGEDLLGAFRSGSIVFDTTLTDLLLRMSDAIRAVLVSIQQTGSEGPEQYGELIQALQVAHATSPASKAELPSQDEPPLAAKALSTPSLTSPLGQDTKTTLSETALRVDITLLDHLMNLAGELVLARNQILQTTKRIDDPVFRAIVQRLNSVTSELQESVMKTRVQPISSLWDKLPRIVRDISHHTGKTVRLEVFGEQTEVDKAILEAIKDPLVHLLRNAIDHGIESPDARLHAGKPTEGHLSLRAFPDGGYVIIELRDDGTGLDTEKIKQQAIARGLLSAKQAEGMSDSQIHRYIFSPGFSTADKITTLSGRGVGMDIVRSHIESISGQIQIASESGRGTTIRLKIPLSLSIIPTLLVSTANDMFAIPEAAVTELVKISVEQHATSLIQAGNAWYLRLRDELLPLLPLDEYLTLGAAKFMHDEFVTIVLSVEGCRFGVVVDHVHNIEEIVVKPLDRQLQKLLLYTGATILGDGRIVLILDPSSMLNHLHLHRPDTLTSYDPPATSATSPETFGKDSFLIVETDDSAHTALPISHVRRLEKLSPSLLESVGDISVVQYRNHVLPIMSLAKRTQSTNSSQQEMSVVVLSDFQGHELGLHVHRIIDISSTMQSAPTAVHTSHDMRVSILDNHSTLMLDVPELFRSVYGDSTNETPISAVLPREDQR
jgi:two-component system chemotaxis sensor kinase CheA